MPNTSDDGYRLRSKGYNIKWEFVCYKIGVVVAYGKLLGPLCKYRLVGWFYFFPGNILVSCNFCTPVSAYGPPGITFLVNFGIG